MQAQIFENLGVPSINFNSLTDEIDLINLFQHGKPLPIFQDLEKIVYVSHLAGLCDAASFRKPLRSVVFPGHFRVLGPAGIQQIAANSGACPSFSRNAVDNHRIIYLF